MSDGDRAAVDVETLCGNTEPIAAVDDLHREGFVQFPEANVLDAQSRLGQELGHGEDRTDSHFVGLAAPDWKAAKDSERAQALFLRALRAHDDAHRRAVG